MPDLSACVYTVYLKKMDLIIYYPILTGSHNLTHLAADGTTISGSFYPSNVACDCEI